ncbi:hypothetical protein BM221_004846 [Beauveria bassiana]|uniref:Uncharacterized protein n=1 Tax=Beauveria bassiana TaxID=176275 RepID=A0A2N6NSH0_BEABA|nr:hypothetical protein BM221_004846 [Beauveria bassiana]
MACLAEAYPGDDGMREFLPGNGIFRDVQRQYLILVLEAARSRIAPAFGSFGADGGAGGDTCDDERVCEALEG